MQDPAQSSLIWSLPTPNKPLLWFPVLWSLPPRMEAPWSKDLICSLLYPQGLKECWAQRKNPSESFWWINGYSHVCFQISISIYPEVPSVSHPEAAVSPSSTGLWVTETLISVAPRAQSLARPRPQHMSVCCELKGEESGLFYPRPPRATSLAPAFSGADYNASFLGENCPSPPWGGSHEMKWLKEVQMCCFTKKGKFRSSAVVQQDRWHLGNTGLHVQSLALNSGLRIRCCFSCLVCIWSLAQKLHMPRGSQKKKKERKIRKHNHKVSSKLNFER